MNTPGDIAAKEAGAYSLESSRWVEGSTDIKSSNLFKCFRKIISSNLLKCFQEGYVHLDIRG